MNMISYKTKIKDIPFNSTPPGYTVLKYTKHNIHKWPGLFTLCIELFNSEKHWNEMWTEEEAQERLNQKANFFVMYNINDLKSPVAYLWIKDDWVYNMFVHSSKPKGSSVTFMQECIHMQDTDKEYIRWETDDWNIAGIKCWVKVGANRV
jgi:hypothetical protein